MVAGAVVAGAVVAGAAVAAAAVVVESADRTVVVAPEEDPLAGGVEADEESLPELVHPPPRTTATSAAQSAETGSGARRTREVLVDLRSSQDALAPSTMMAS